MAGGGVDADDGILKHPWEDVEEMVAEPLHDTVTGAGAIIEVVVGGTGGEAGGIESESERLDLIEEASGGPVSEGVRYRVAPPRVGDADVASLAVKLVGYRYKCCGRSGAWFLGEGIDVCVERRVEDGWCRVVRERYSEQVDGFGVQHLRYVRVPRMVGERGRPDVLWSDAGWIRGRHDLGVHLVDGREIMFSVMVKANATNKSSYSNIVRLHPSKHNHSPHLTSP